MKQHTPAALRNRGPILEVLRETLPARGTVLEIASGSGEHVIFFAEALPALQWQPSDQSAKALASINAYRDEARLENVAPPLCLDVGQKPWPVSRADAVVCINLIHIAPWEAVEALLAGAGRLLPPTGPLVLYGPFRFHGSFTAPSNESFDRQLRWRNVSWGVRDVDDLTKTAARAGLVLERTVPRPANNHVLVLRKQ